MNVLAIGAHFDDVELGCGGTLLKHVSKGDNVYILVVTKSDYVSNISNHQRNKTDAYKEGLLSAKSYDAQLITGNFETLTLTPNKELINYLSKVIYEIKPKIVYTHFIGDQHLDHKAVAEASLIATRNVDEVYSYMSNIYDTNPKFSPNYFVDISDFFDKKIKKVNIYKSELETHKHWSEQLKLFNGLYGLKEHKKYVEPFEVIKISR